MIISPSSRDNHMYKQLHVELLAQHLASLCFFFDTGTQKLPSLVPRFVSYDSWGEGLGTRLEVMGGQMSQ